MHRVNHGMVKTCQRRPFGKTQFIRAYQVNTTLLEGKVPHSVGRIYCNEDLLLQSKAIIPKESFHITYSTWGDPSLPKVFLFPSMSNSSLPIESPLDVRAKGAGWWGKVMGIGSNYGLDITKYHVICGAVLGSPFGTTSPLTTNARTGVPFGSSFPRITVADMAKAQALLLKALKVDKVFAIVGGSMGGMQSIQFACMYPDLYDRFVSIAATAHTSPSTVALRSMQRAAVRADPMFEGGNYTPPASPSTGLKLARMIGTVAYRSRLEFDSRFSWVPKPDVDRFEVEMYLEHQANKFTQNVNYDANCYLLLSEAMDRMNIGDGFQTFEQGAARVPQDKMAMLLSYNTDVLTPPQDLERLASVLGARGVSVHYESLNSKFGHDSFLIDSEAPPLVERLKAFLDKDGGVDQVRRLVSEMHDI